MFGRINPKINRLILRTVKSEHFKVGKLFIINNNRIEREYASKFNFKLCLIMNDFCTRKLCKIDICIFFKAFKKYENIFYEGIGEESESTMTQSQIEAFKNNLNNNCDNLLKTEFSDKDFKSNIQCDIDLENMTYNIQSLEVGVKETGIKLVDNIRININRESQEVISKEEVIGNSEEIKKYLQETFNIPIEKIKLYSMNK